MRCDRSDCDLQRLWWGYVDLNHGPLPYQGDGESALVAILPCDLVFGRHVVSLTAMHCPAFTRVVLSVLGLL
jgi:hypothetical protein